MHEKSNSISSTFGSLMATSCFSNLPIIDCHYDRDQYLGASWCQRRFSEWLHWWCRNIYFLRCCIRLLDRWQLLWCVLCCSAVVGCTKLKFVADFPTRYPRRCPSFLPLAPSAPRRPSSTESLPQALTGK